MDKLLVQLMLLDELTLTGIGILLAFVGALLAALFVKVRFQLRRVAYLWLLAIAVLAISASQFAWLGIGAATRMGFFSPFVIALFSLTVLYGAAIYIGSAARSNHISGTTKYAWLGLIPLANLWLLMKAPEEKTGSKSFGPKVSLFADVILVLAAIFVLLLSRTVTAAFEAHEPDPESFLAFNELLTSVQTVEEVFAWEAENTAPTLPLRMDEVTVFSAISAHGHKLRMGFIIEDDIEDIDPNFKNDLAAEQCAKEMFGDELARGGTIIFAYQRPDGSLIREFEITGKDCTA